MMKRAWFDEKDYFEFFSLQAVCKRTALPKALGEIY